MKVLEPYRKQIDELDHQLIELLKQRFDIIDLVKVIKHQNNIPAVLPDRVDEVRDNAVARAKEIGLDADFVYELWTRLIERSCEREDIYLKDKTND